MPKLPSLLKRNVRLLDIHSHAGVDPSLYLTHSFPFARNLRDNFEENERFGITHAAVFPLCTSVYYHLPSLAKGRVRIEGRIGRAPFHFENEQLLRQLYELFPSYRRMFIPFAIVDTLRETRQQVRILTQLIERYPFYGLKVHPRMTQANIATLAREGRPILEFAKAHDLPILFHSAYRGSPDPYSQISQLIAVARHNPSLRFCAAHFCGFHQATFDEVARLGNIWVDSAAMSIGCDLVLEKSPIYESGDAKIPANYRDPARVFAVLAERYPDRFMWGSDNPAHTFVNHMPARPGGKAIHLELWSSMARERDLLKHVSGELYRKVAYRNALNFITG